jgi:hypothetical protein
MFNRVTECSTRHRCGVAIEKVSQARPVTLPSFSNPATDRLLDQVFRVVRENLSDAEGVIHVAAANEEPGAHDGSPSLIPVPRGGEPIKGFSGLVPQVASDDMRRCPIDKVPGVNPIVSSQVKVVELPPPGGGSCLPAGLKIHDAHGDHSRRMVRPIQQYFCLLR